MQEDLTDAHLVMRARADDREAFTLLIERYQVMLTYIALGKVKNEEVARELVQEALLHAYLSLDQLRDPARFKNWLYGIVLNMSYSWLRTYKGGTRVLNTSLDDGPLLEQHDDPLSPDPQELFIEQELQQLVREAVYMLSPKNRAAMQLFYYEGQSLLQISHNLDISLAAVKSRIYKGRDQLRMYLKTLYPELAETPIRKERQTSMITVTLAKVLHRVEIYPYRTILVLLDEQHQQALPLWFSAKEYQQSGRFQMFAQEKGVLLEPLTTDFLTHILAASESTVEEIAIDTLQKETLYARIQVRSVNATHIVKARLNDALPLALRLNCPLKVSEEVLTTLGMKLTDWGETLEQQIDAITDLAAKTPVMNYQGTLHSFAPHNLDFADGLHGWRPGGSGGPEAYDFRLDAQTTYRNKNSLAITVKATETPTTTGSRAAHLIHEGFLADRYRGQRIRMITYVKTQEVACAFFDVKVVGMELLSEQESTKAKIAMTINKQKPFEGTSDWTRHELIFDVPDDASSIIIGFELQDQGKAWLDGFQLERVEKSIPLVTGTRVLPPLQHPHNLDFAQNLEHWRMVGTFAQDYSDGVDLATASAYLKADKMEPRGSVILMQTVSEQNYRNKRVRFSATIKTVDIQQAGLYLHAGLRDAIVQAENSIQGTTDWTRYDLTLDVPDQNRAPIDFGFTLDGKGQIWARDVKIDIVEKSRP